MSEEAAYARQVETWTQARVEEGEKDFANLVGHLPGIDPGQVISALERLERHCENKGYAKLLEAARRPRPTAVEAGWKPFVPHPLDFDWRFTNDSIDELVRIAASFGRCKSIALLGTPSLVSAFENALPEATISLFELNPLWIRHFAIDHPRLTLIETDLESPLHGSQREGFDLVVADPPWYPSAEASYLGAAAHLLRPDGILILSIPAIGTRPGILRERAALEVQAEGIGFRNVSQLPGTVTYRTPPFEANALRASGIHMPLPAWRRGDLSVYRFHPTTQASPPKSARSLKDTWAEIQVSGVRFKIRVAPPRPGVISRLSLLSLITGDVLPSVSARHPLRSAVDVWTSGNRIYRCEDGAKLVALCEHLRDNMVTEPDAEGSVMPVPEKFADSDIHRRILEIVALERREYVVGS